MSALNLKLFWDNGRTLRSATGLNPSSSCLICSRTALWNDSAGWEGKSFLPEIQETTKYPLVVGLTGQN